MTDIDIELLDEEPIEVDFGEVTQTGGGSVTSYNALTNKPQINGVTLIGNKSFADLGINSLIDTEVESYVEEHKDELKGDKGDNGTDGDDGYSPSASISQTIGGAVVTITDKDGTTTATISNGTDGYSPAASIERISTGAIITIVDKNGTTSATINDGKNGKDGKDGTNGNDYVITSADYDAIATVVVGKLPIYNGGVD